MARGLKIFWTENSVHDLLAIKDFISVDSIDRAETWIRKLFSYGEELAAFPSRGRIVPEFKQENIRELLIENYRLVYRVKASKIEILTVFEGHRQIRKNEIQRNK